MEVKEHLLNELHIPAELVQGLDFSDFPKLVKGTPEWARYYKILNWIDEQRGNPIKNRGPFGRFIEYCHIAAATDFE